jgi:hypothetical protein
MFISMNCGVGVSVRLAKVDLGQKRCITWREEVVNTQGFGKGMGGDANL